jgi:hypothetical protein
VAILLAVAAVQVVLVRSAGLTPWKGGGFGMFAAVDGGAVRSVRIVLEREGHKEELALPPSLEMDADRAAAFPRRFMLERLARRVVEREARHGRRVDTVTVEAWSATLEPDGSHAEARLLKAHVHEVTAEPDSGETGRLHQPEPKADHR